MSYKLNHSAPSPQSRSTTRPSLSFLDPSPSHPNLPPPPPLEDPDYINYKEGKKRRQSNIRYKCKRSSQTSCDAALDCCVPHTPTSQISPNITLNPASSVKPPHGDPSVPCAPPSPKLRRGSSGMSMLLSAFSSTPTRQSSFNDGGDKRYDQFKNYGSGEGTIDSVVTHGWVNRNILYLKEEVDNNTGEVLYRDVRDGLLKRLEDAPPVEWGYLCNVRNRVTAKSVFRVVSEEEVRAWLRENVYIRESEIQGIITDWEGGMEKLMGVLEGVGGVSVVPGQSCRSGKVGGSEVFDRLVDYKCYTGASRHRFDSRGVGKGRDGRDEGSKIRGFDGNTRSKGLGSVGDDGTVKMEEFINRK